jgi:prolyl-tRNA synthetase
MVPQSLGESQEDRLGAARDRREERSVRGMEDYDEFLEHIDEERGVVYSGWCGDAECEEKAREESKATIRVVPDPEFRSDDAPGTCLVCGDEATEEVLWAQAY